MQIETCHGRLHATSNTLHILCNNSIIQTNFLDVYKKLAINCLLGFPRPIKNAKKSHHLDVVSIQLYDFENSGSFIKLTMATILQKVRTHIQAGVTQHDVLLFSTLASKCMHALDQLMLSLSKSVPFVLWVTIQNTWTMQHIVINIFQIH